MLTLQCIPEQKQKLSLKVQQKQMVRGIEYFIDQKTSVILPIKPEISTNKAKKSGYRFIETTWDKIQNDKIIFIVFLKTHNKKIPNELREIIDI